MSMSFACSDHDLIGHTLSSLVICVTCNAGSAGEQIMMITRSSPSCKRLKRATPRTSRVCTKLRHTKLVQDSEDEEIFRRRHLRAMGIISSILACNVIEGWSIYLICHARKAKYLKWQVKHSRSPWHYSSLFEIATLCYQLLMGY